MNSSGQRAELIAQLYLQFKGLSLLFKNYNCRYGEIDLIMCDRSTLIFVEVRYRYSRALITPEESVNDRKQRKIIATATYFLGHHPKYQQTDSRFDVVAISGALFAPRIQWYPAAFETSA